MASAGLRAASRDREHPLGELAGSPAEIQAQDPGDPLQQADPDRRVLPEDRVEFLTREDEEAGPGPGDHASVARGAGLKAAKNE